MIRMMGFTFVVAATLALSLSAFSIFPGTRAANDPRYQITPAGQQIQLARQSCHSQSPQPVAFIANASYVHGNAILWRPPVDIECRDLFYGVGGPENAPDPSMPFTYVKRSKSGSQKKIIVRDVHGVEWTVKFGPEARPETAATRIVWAAGYHVDQDYFVHRARIVGQEYIDACDVRFERHDGRFEEVGNWSWADNPFLDTPELDGLRVVMALLKNWDIKTSNNDILAPTNSPGPQIYYVADLGATFGRTNTFLQRAPLFGDVPPINGFSTSKAKGNVSGYVNENFIKEVSGGRVYFSSRRTRVRHALDGVLVANARFMGDLLGRLSDKQLADAFCASGFDPAETSIYVSILRARIIELQRL